MDCFDTPAQYAYQHPMLPTELLPLELSPPPPPAPHDLSLYHLLPAHALPLPFPLPLSLPLPLPPASCSAATHLQLCDEHEPLFESLLGCDASPVPYFSFSSTKDRIKHELEMALRAPSQPVAHSEHSFVSTQANSIVPPPPPLPPPPPPPLPLPPPSPPPRTASCAYNGITKRRKASASKSKRTRAPARPWTEQEHERFKQSLELYGRNWEQCAKYIGTRRAQLVRSHAQKYLIKLWKLGLPLPDKVAESGRGYTLSGKPLLPDSASAKSYLTRISAPAVPLDQSD
ncbi:unnamed protein product [Agarophyton chilense]